MDVGEASMTSLGRYWFGMSAKIKRGAAFGSGGVQPVGQDAEGDACHVGFDAGEYQADTGLAARLLNIRMPQLRTHIADTS